MCVAEGEHLYFLSRIGAERVRKYEKSSTSKYCTTRTVEMLTRRFSALLRKISSGLFDYWVCVPGKTLFALAELNQADDNAKCISTKSDNTTQEDIFPTKFILRALRAN